MCDPTLVSSILLLAGSAADADMLCFPMDLDSVSAIPAKATASAGEATVTLDAANYIAGRLEAV